MASETQEPIYRFTAEHARTYDQGIRVAGLGYDLLHDLTVAMLGSLLPEQARVLVVGAGTGEEIVQLGERYPGWSFLGVDPSAEMLAVARRRIDEAGLADRATLHEGTVDCLPLDDRYDSATLLLVMHFLPDDGAKLALLHGIAARLRPGAPLVLADLHGDLESAGGRLRWDGWRQRQRMRGKAEHDLEEMFRQLTQVVHFVPEERIDTLLAEASFTGIERVFQALLFGGWIARRTIK